MLLRPVSLLTNYPWPVELVKVVLICCGAVCPWSPWGAWNRPAICKVWRPLRVRMCNRFCPVFSTYFHFVTLSRGLSKHRACIWVWGLFMRGSVYSVVGFGIESLWILLFSWTEMADRVKRKPAKRYYSFSGASRKDSVKALRFSRSLNLKRTTSEISKRQVGTEISDPFEFPLELKVTYSLCLFLNILLKKFLD